MLIIPCPYCGPRPELEFSYAGQAHVVRPTAASNPTPEQWNAFQYERSNVKGLHAERWRHVHGCARFFNVVRDTTTDDIVRSYRSGEK
jgi:sarcosine oxidase, subunit delta